MGLRTILGLKQPRNRRAGMVKASDSREAPPKSDKPSPRRIRLAPIPEPPDYSAWFEGKEFSTDWLSSKIIPWFTALQAWRDAPAEVLEVGSYEGRSAIVFLSYMPAAHVTCVDTFKLEDVTAGIDLGQVVEQRFDANLLPFGDRLTKIKGAAAGALDQLRAEGKSYDVIYLDAGKKRDGVFGMSALAWPLLRVGGVLIWDDLKWGAGKADKDRPESAIRLFCSAFSDAVEVLHDDRQMIVRKSSDWPLISVSR
jgi:predicted O-methyltransferase YrrM